MNEGFFGCPRVYFGIQFGVRAHRCCVWTWTRAFHLMRSQEHHTHTHTQHMCVPPAQAAQDKVVLEAGHLAAQVSTLEKQCRVLEQASKEERAKREKEREKEKTQREQEQAGRENERKDHQRETAAMREKEEHLNALVQEWEFRYTEAEERHAQSTESHRDQVISLHSAAQQEALALQCALDDKVNTLGELAKDKQGLATRVEELSLQLQEAKVCSVQPALCVMRYAVCVMRYALCVVRCALCVMRSLYMHRARTRRALSTPNACLMYPVCLLYICQRCMQGWITAEVCGKVSGMGMGYRSVCIWTHCLECVCT